jgi:hypothetical protein
VQPNRSARLCRCRPAILPANDQRKKSSGISVVGLNLSEAA